MFLPMLSLISRAFSSPPELAILRRSTLRAPFSTRGRGIHSSLFLTQTESILRAEDSEQSAGFKRVHSIWIEGALREQQHGLRLFRTQHSGGRSVPSSVFRDP